MRRSPAQPSFHELKDDRVKLMAKHEVMLGGESEGGVAIERGMVVRSREGREVGQVAAVAVDLVSHEAYCLILGHLPPGGYQSLPVTWIDRVEGGMVFLHAGSDAVQAVLDWPPI